MARSGRTGPARALTDLNRAVSVQYNWNEDVARCDRVLGLLGLAAGDPGGAREKVAAAAVTFRDGDYLVELAETLPVLADCARGAGDLDAADQRIAEALALAGPRGLIPAQAAALTVRARIHADRAAAGDPTHLDRGRDAADTAHRLAVRHRLAWHELDALDAHARLDAVARSTNGWAARAATLRARLIPAGLDPLADHRGTPGRRQTGERGRRDTALGGFREFRVRQGQGDPVQVLAVLRVLGVQRARRQGPAVPRAIVAEELITIGVAALPRPPQRRPQRGPPGHAAGSAGDLAAVRREAVVAVEVQEDRDDRAVRVRGDLHAGVPGQIGAGQPGAGGRAGARDQAVLAADLLGAGLQDGPAEQLGQLGAASSPAPGRGGGRAADRWSR